MSLLDIVQRVARRVKYASQVITAFSATDPAIQLMLDCAQDAGDDASERADWALLKNQPLLTFTGNGTTPAFILPNTFQRLSPSDTFISSNFPTLRMPGPVNESDLIAMKRLPVVAQPSVWRQVGYVASSGTPPVMSIEFFPVLQVGEVVSYYGANANWIMSSAGTPYVPPLWHADTDITLIPERVITFGAIWRWKKANGLDYSEDMMTAESILDRLQAQEATGEIIHMSRTYTIDNSTWFPGTITSLLDDDGD